MKAVPIQSSDDPRSLKKVDKVYVSNKLPALFYMLLKRKTANTTLTGVSVLTPCAWQISVQSIFGEGRKSINNFN